MASMKNLQRGRAAIRPDMDIFYFPGPKFRHGAMARLEAREGIEPLAAGERVLRHRLESLHALARVGPTRPAEG